MAMLFEKVANDEMSIEKADALLRITDRQQRSFEAEMKLALAQSAIGQKVEKIRNIELKSFPEEDPKELEGGE